MANVSDEVAQVATGWINNVVTESTKKASEIVKELLKLLLLKLIELKKSDRARMSARNTIKKLLSGNHQLSAPVSIDRQDVKRIRQLAKEFNLPVAIVHGREGTRLFFREVDFNRVSELMKEAMRQKLTLDNMKQIVISKEEASFFKTRAKRLELPVTYFKNGDQVKVGFRQDDLEKVQAIIKDIQEERKQIPRIRMQFDRLKDQIDAASRGKPILRLYETEQKKSVSIRLPISRNDFIKIVRSEFGYSYKEASDLATRVRNRAEKNMSIIGLKGEFKWLPNVKDISKNVERLERDIKHSLDPKSLSNFSFSKLQMADDMKTRMLSITDKVTGQALYTMPAKSDDLLQEIKQSFPVDDKLASELVAKAGKMGFLKDGETKAINYEIRKSKNAKTATIIHGDQEVKISLEDQLTAISKLQQSFGISKTKATSIYNRVVKHGVKDVVKSARKKSVSQVKTINKVAAISKSKGAR